MSELLVYTGFSDAGSDDGNEYREPTIPEVVAWLREQGAIDYERAHAILVQRGIRGVGSVDSGLAHHVVDAALPGGNE